MYLTVQLLAQGDIRSPHLQCPIKVISQDESNPSLCCYRVNDIPHSFVLRDFFYEMILC